MGLFYNIGSRRCIYICAWHVDLQEGEEFNLIARTSSDFFCGANVEFSEIEAPIKRQINALDVFHNSASLCLDLCLSGPGIEQCVSSPLYHGHHSPSCGQDVDRSPNTTKKLLNKNIAKSYILRDGPIDSWISFKSSDN